MAAFNLMSLLQSAGLVPPTPENEDIIVNATKKKKGPATPQAALLGEPDEEQMNEAPIRTGNRDFIQQSLQDAENSRPGARKGDLQHKGMFGIKGTLRDVLGAVSDAFLVQSGNKAVYAPHKQQEALADAMAGFTQGDPRAGIERVAALPGGAEFAQKMYNDTVQNQTQKANQKTLESTRQQTAASSRATQIDKFVTRVGQMLNGTEGNPAKRAAVLKLAGQQAAATGLDPEELGISEKLTPEEQAAFVSGATTVNQQNTYSQRERFEPMKEQGRNTRAAAANQVRRETDNPPPPVKRTASEVDAEILDNIRSGKATPADIQIYKERLIKSQKRNRFEGSDVPSNLKTKPGGGKLVYRGGEWVTK